MTDIPHLIEKLEAATEGSITLDVEVLNACGFGSSTQYPTKNGGWNGEFVQWIAPTRSFQDALRMLQATFPSWVWMREYSGEITVAPEPSAWGWASKDGANDAMNLCIALLLSKQDQFKEEAA